MYDLLWRSLFALPPALDSWRRLVLGMPGDDVQFDIDLSWLERNSHILYPLFAIGTVALLVVGILSAWHSDEMSGVLKVEYKREIIGVLRRTPGGVPVAKLAKHLKLTVHRTDKLVEEMVKDGQIACELRQGIATARIRLR